MSSIARTISSMQNRSWTRSWPAFAIVLGEGLVREQPDDRRREGLGLVVRDEEAGHAVLDHLRDPADVRGDDRPRQGHRLEDREALGLAMRRQDRDVERGGDRRDVVAAAREHDPMGDAVRGGAMLQRVAQRCPRRRSGGTRPGPIAGRAARRRGASGGPSPARAGRRRRRSATRAPSRTRRGACSMAPGGRSAAGRRRCR